MKSPSSVRGDVFFKNKGMLRPTRFENRRRCCLPACVLPGFAADRCTRPFAGNMEPLAEYNGSSGKSPLPSVAGEHFLGHAARFHTPEVAKCRCGGGCWA
jgi:hypothetical protein